jgi:SAM-dependent methyltransferase
VQPVTPRRLATVSPAAKRRYDCARELLPAELRERFVELDEDDAARTFMDEAIARPHGALITAAYRELRRFLSDYDAYGLLGMYPMHLLSTAQLERLLGEELQTRTHLLDVGAGSGGVTAHAAKLFEQVSATEASWALRRKLRARGYRVIEHDFALEPYASQVRFDAITCFNVLDRCSHPRSLLTHLHAVLQPHGRLVLSVPLPLRPHVHVGAQTVDPEERLPKATASWEAGVVSVAREVLAPAGWQVSSISRAPYLCRGDSAHRLHVLDAAIFVCKPG